MQFGSLVFRNVMRRKLRSSLTVFSVAIAVGSVVALVGIAFGFKESFIKFYDSNEVDLIVTRAGSQRRLTSTIPETLNEQIANLPGVMDVVPELADVVSFPEFNLYVVPVTGLLPDSKSMQKFELREGVRITNSDETTVMLGSLLAETLNKGIGETVDLIEDEPFRIVGIYESPHVFEDGSMVISIRQLQRLMGREGQLTGTNIIFEEGVDDDQIRATAEKVKGLEQGISVRPAKEHVESMVEIQIAIAMAWLTSAVAIFIGALGTLNTMFMSVQERTPELGILKALGWDRRSIIKMILSESVLLGLIGGAVGTVAAVLLVKLLTKMPMVNGLIEGQVHPSVIVQAILVAIAVGMLGGLLPSIRASRLAPTVALRE